ncbi:MAG: hypothetical protein KatS3mg110_4167 [Pirellulaceae bacterium]|nr:MAG: hypothetical protein KatS3mg110_4167 [Pirellulaceae bacterium]
MTSTQQDLLRQGRQAVVLVVDTSSESRQVWQTALERRGYSAIVTRTVQEAWPWVERCVARVVLVDNHRSIPPDLRQLDPNEAVSTEPAEQDLLWLGKVSPDGRLLWQTLEKPYHYAAVLRRIEVLCDDASPDGRHD